VILHHRQRETGIVELNFKKEIAHSITGAKIVKTNLKADDAERKTNGFSFPYTWHPSLVKKRRAGFPDKSLPFPSSPELMLR
jgi:hypothetical protein